MKQFIYFFLFVLVSCGGSEEPEVIDLNDVLPSSERYAEGDSVQVEVEDVYFSDALSDEAKTLADTFGFDIKTLDSVPERWFPDRFEKLSAEKWGGWIGKSPAQSAVYSFADSLSMKNTLFNWLDCFGKKCNSLMLFEEKKLVRNSFVLYGSDKKLIYLESESALNVKLILDNIQRLYARATPLYVITQMSGQKTVWWTREKNKWVTIEKKEL